MKTIYVLERPGPDTTASGLRLRIPDGTYKMKWATTTGNGSLRSVLPLPWLYGDSVPLARHIYIHHGNKPENSDGCLLVGLSRGLDRVDSSRQALDILKSYLNRIGIENVQLIVNSNYA
ncbi:MAG: hypothetical protein HEQ39_06850 [Rhizobacter sp.]